MDAGHDPDFKSTVPIREWIDCVLFCVFSIIRGSAELLEESGGKLSPAESTSSIQTCIPFSWFGDKDRDRDREPSSSSSSLPYAATETSSEQSQDRRPKV